jgi:N-methylhydantoinase A
VVNYRVSAIGLSPAPKWSTMPKGAQDAVKGRREVYFEGGFRPCSVYERRRLNPGQEIDGPAVIEQAGSTTLLSCGERARVDPYGNLIITLTNGEVGE